ncbi:MAG: DNA ligase D [Planctomycetota bacterium]
MGHLEEYRAKRKASKTPEPMGGPAHQRPHLFVVQKHRATSLHYDLRLEWKGVLLSWAVPKGPHRDVAVKRLAMQTEDHPVEYADFEGVIPKGNYGAGEVIVWDQGSWVPLKDPDRGLEEGKLLFELKGHKLRGRWTWFRTKRDDDTGQWLFVKEKDGWAANENDWAETSVFSGLSVEELKTGSDRAETLRAAIGETDAPKKDVDAAAVKPMLAQTSERVFSRPGWLYELKYDGFRLLADKRGADVRLFYRSGRDATALYPEIVRSVAHLPYESLLLDGEMVVLDEEARPDFQQLQKRAHLQNAAEIAVATVERPVVLYVFDLLAAEGFDLRGLPLSERKSLVERVVPAAGTLRYASHIEERGEEFYDQVREMGLEGVLAKKSDSLYRPGRSDSWLKLKVDRTGDFVIVGFTPPKGSRAGLGALHLAAYDGGELAYAGRVGTGFREQQLDELRQRLDPLEIESAPCGGAVPKTRGHHWVRPELCCEVRFKERTADGMLRHPSFLRVRDDKQPEECIAPDARGADRDAPTPVIEDNRHGVFEPSNLNKVFWPEEGYTKGDLLEFYREIGPYVLPYLRDRPVVLTRYPDGINGKSFFQKDAPSWVPDWVRTERIWSEQTQREIDYFLCDDVESLVFLANLGTIPFHVWSSRVTDLAHPDWCILDLDPKDAPFSDVVKVARGIRKLCEEIEFPSYVKTSGSTGLHVLLPLNGQCTYEQSRSLGELMARAVEARLPKIATTARSMDKREGRVYIDFVQNGHGRLLAAPFSVRPRPGATVSAPLRWSEVNAKLSPARFTMKTVPDRMRRLDEDPLLGVLEDRPDLVAILGRLSELV